MVSDVTRAAALTGMICSAMEMDDPMCTLGNDCVCHKCKGMTKQIQLHVSDTLCKLLCLQKMISYDKEKVYMDYQRGFLLMPNLPLQQMESNEKKIVKKKVASKEKVKRTTTRKLHCFTEQMC